MITSAGVVAVAIINKKGNKDQDDSPDADLDVNDILSRLISMAAENQRKEASIQKLKALNSEHRQRIHFLEQFIEEQKRGSTHERSARGTGTPGDAQQEPDLE